MMDQLLRSVIPNIGGGGKCDHGGITASSFDTIPATQFFSIQTMFMKDWEDTMNDMLCRQLPPDKMSVFDNPFTMNRVIMKRLSDTCNCLPNINDVTVRKYISRCLVLLGTDYVLQVNEHSAKKYKEGFLRRANIVAVATIMYDGADKETSIKEASKWRSLKDYDEVRQFFDKRNGCQCLKKEDTAGATKAETTNSNGNVIVGAYCANCKERKKKLQRCNRCKTTMYCGKDCQTKHWGEHKAWCKKNAK